MAALHSGDPEKRSVIKVVISPKGLHAPPAFAATTILFVLVPKVILSMVIKTVDKIRAVVKLSATGLIKRPMLL